MATFNIRIGYGSRDPKLRVKSLWRAPKNLGPVIAALASLDLDIAGLQEVHGPAQAEKIARALKLNHSYLPHSPHGSGSGWGLALLSRHKILSVVGRKISTGTGNTRSIQIVTLQVEGRPLIAVNVHIDKDIRDDSSIKAILNAVAAIRGPVVLLGDFNMKPKDPRWRSLKKRFHDSVFLAKTTGSQAVWRRGTFGGHTGKKVRRIDYIWIGGTQHLRVLDAGLADQRHWPASDHLAYFARLAVLPPRSR